MGCMMALASSCDTTALRMHACVHTSHLPSMTQLAVRLCGSSLCPVLQVASLSDWLCAIIRVFHVRFRMVCVRQQCLMALEWRQGMFFMWNTSIVF